MDAMYVLLRLAFAATCCLTLSLAAAAAEDLTIVYNITVPNPYLVGPVSGTATLWISANKVRWSNGSKDRIFEVATGRKIFVDHQEREYVESTPDEREANRRAVVAKAEELKAKAKEKEKELKAKSKQAEAKTDGEESTLDEEMGRLRVNVRRLQELRRKVKEELDQRPKLTPKERQKLLALLADLADREEGAKEGLAKVEKEFAQMPPVLRDNLGKPKTSVLTNISTESHKGTSKKDIVGYNCEQHVMSITHTFTDGSKEDRGQLETWVTPELEGPVSFDIVKEVADLLTRAGATAGFPLGIIRWDKSGVEFDYSVQAIEIKRAMIDPSAFEVSVVGYTKRELSKP
jgi:hypothetical protein